MLSNEDRAWIKENAPKLAGAGGLSAEQWRPAGFMDSVKVLQLFEKLGYAGWGFTEQTQSWIYQSIWPLCAGSKAIPEHEAFYDTFCLIAAAAMATTKLHLTTVTDCYRRPPSVIAQTLKTLDQISKGRVTILLGTGESKQFEPHGLTRTLPRYERLEEFIKIVKALVRTEKPLTMEGKYWPQKDALIAVPCYDAKNPPKVFMVGGGPTGMKIAGRVADGVMTYTPGAYGGEVAGFEEDISIMRKEAERVGRDPKSIPVIYAPNTILCENDEQVRLAYESPYTRSTCLNLTPIGSYWHRWGSQHPLGDNHQLSHTQRSTMYSQKECLAFLAKVTENDIDHTMFIGTPEDVAKKAAPWAKAAGDKELPLGVLNLGNMIFPEQQELASDGLPRWHHLQLRYNAEINRLLKA